MKDISEKEKGKGRGRKKDDWWGRVRGVLIIDISSWKKSFGLCVLLILTRNVCKHTMN